MITESKNKAKRSKPQKSENKLSPAEKQEMLQRRYNIGKKPEHFRGVR